uniref:Astacin domain-containing protein n=1 Tax=Strongyloides venezuelensis TaxID=75913 RepID=A0A0K0FI60_STRVS
MKLSFLVILISILYILQNVVESKKSKKSKLKKLTKEKDVSTTIKKKSNKNKPGKKPKSVKRPKPKSKTKRKTTFKPSHKPGVQYISPYYTKQNSIKYYLDKQLESKFGAIIEKQTRYISFYTCLKIEKENFQSKKVDIDIAYCSKNYVKLSTKKGKPTKVCLNDNVTNNEFLFYIGYALGLVPEITRNDSRLHVEVFEKNISSTSDYEKYYKVKKYSSTIIANSSFDYYSKMLSFPYFKSKDKEKRMYTFLSDLAKYYEKNVYITENFIFNDVKRLWHLYCSKECGPPDCRNGGYFIHGCQKCSCPLPFYGEKCEKLYRNHISCGNTQEFIANSSKSFYTIQNASIVCFYSIKSKNGKKVHFNIENLYKPHVQDCNRNVILIVKYREDKGAGGLSLCGNYTNISFPPLSSEVYFIYSNIGGGSLHFSIKEQ